MELPAISVIIPLYNAERYIGDCLYSVLTQTFKNFEVIVVDDCSTDNSVAVVKSFEPHFGGRLRFARMKKNSGSGTAPRNFGLTLSRGEYIFFLDNDDLISANAFAELYPVAKKFNADVVACEKYFGIFEQFWNKKDFHSHLQPSSYKRGGFVDKPTLITDNLIERVQKIQQRHFLWNVWAQLIRRDFIFENRLKFVGIISDDVIFTICELCCAKKYVVVPNIVNCYRVRPDSLIHSNIIPSNDKLDKHLHCWITMLKCGVEYLDKFLDEHELFSKRPDVKYVLFDTFVAEMLRYVNGIYKKLPAHILDGILRKEFGGGDNSALLTFLFSAFNVNYLRLIDYQKRVNDLEAEVRRLKGNT